MKLSRLSIVIGLLFFGLSFSLGASANETLKVPVMSPDAGDDISGDAENAVRIEQSENANGTTTVKASDVGAKPKKWTVGFGSENALAAGQNSWKTFNSFNNANVTYDLGNDRSLQVRQYFLYNVTNQDSQYEWTIGDTALQYTDAGMKIAGADNLFMARLYVPVDYYDAQVGKYELRLYDFVTQGVNKWIDLTYFVDPRFYTYTTTNAGQTGFQDLVGVQMSYASKSAFSAPFLTVYAQDLWGNTGKGVGLAYNGSAGVYSYNAVNQDYLNVDLGTTLHLSKTVSTTIFYEYTDSVRAALQPIDNGNSSWNLWFSASM